jgi:hypothetical protein
VAYHGFKPAEQALQIGDDVILSSHIDDDVIVNADINSSAAIATSKLSGALTSVGSHGLATVATSGSADDISSGTLAAARVATLNQNTTGQAGTVATIAGLAPNTATTQATQGAITSTANLATVGTITTGVWNAGAVTSSGDIRNIGTGVRTIRLESTTNAQNLNLDFFNNANAIAGRITYQEGAGAFYFQPNQAGGGTALTLDWSNNATFAGDVTIPHKLIHAGDADTYIQFQNDRITHVAGGHEFLDYSPVGADYLVLGSTADVNVQLRSGSGAINMDGGDSTIAVVGDTTFAGRIEVGTFPNSTTNSGEAWVGRASDRQDGTLTVQLGGDNDTSTKFEIVDRAWSKVISSISGEAPGSSFSIDSSGDATFGGDINYPQSKAVKISDAPYGGCEYGKHYSVTGTSWVDIVTITFNNNSWGGASVNIDQSLCNTYNGQVICAVVGYSTYSTVNATMYALGNGNAGLFQWVAVGASGQKLRTMSSNSVDSHNLLIRVVTSNRFGDSDASITWH